MLVCKNFEVFCQYIFMYEADVEIEMLTSSVFFFLVTDFPFNVDNALMVKN